jgi:hypothetical protein
MWQVITQNGSINTALPSRSSRKTTMNGAQLFTAHCDSDERDTCPKSIPQGLKPIVIPALYGTTEVVP